MIRKLGTSVYLKHSAYRFAIHELIKFTPFALNCVGSGAIKSDTWIVTELQKTISSKLHQRKRVVHEN